MGMTQIDVNLVDHSSNFWGNIKPSGNLAVFLGFLGAGPLPPPGLHQPPPENSRPHRAAYIPAA
eukprot:4210673-Pyramimonas_sp.AAC.1